MPVALPEVATPAQSTPAAAMACRARLPKLSPPTCPIMRTAAPARAAAVA